MKILIIGDIFYRSSTGQIAYLLGKEATNNGDECKIAVGFCPDKEQREYCIIVENKVEWMFHRIASFISGYEGRYSPFATRKVKKLIDKYNPDVVQLFNLHGYWINQFELLKYIAKKNIKVVYSMLDEYPYLGHCCYAYDCKEFVSECKECRYDKKEYIKSLFFRRGHEMFMLKKNAYDDVKDITFTAPQWVADRAKKSSLLKNRSVKIIDECIDTDNIYFPHDVSMLRERYGIENKTVILNVCVASDKRKGFVYYKELANRLVNDDRFIFFHVGYNLKEDDIPTNMIVIPYVKNPKCLSDYFCLADLFICTSLADTMPNTCLNALACGTPVCGFNITGVSYVADEVCGKFVAPGDVDALDSIVKDTEKKSDYMVEYTREYAIKRYSSKVFYNGLKEIYES